jgi:hypothetical protein
MSEELKTRDISPEYAIAKRLAALHLIPTPDLKLVSKIITKGFQEYQCASFTFEDFASSLDEFIGNGTLPEDTAALTEDECLGIVEHLWDEFDASEGMKWDIVHDAVLDCVKER